MREVTLCEIDDRRDARLRAACGAQTVSAPTSRGTRTTRDRIATTMGIREIDWSTAEVTGKRTLTVGLAGDSDVDWCAAFTAVARLLDAGSHNHLWGEVGARAKKGRSR